MKDVLSAFNQLQKAYRKYCYQAVAPLGMKMSEMLCVLYLYNFPNDDTAHAIAQHAQLSAGMVSKSLDSLREAGYIRSQRDEKDNRFYHLHLTQKAQEPVKRLRVAQSYFISEVAKGISGEEFQQVAGVAERMLENLSRHPQLGEGTKNKDESKNEKEAER